MGTLSVTCYHDLDPPMTLFIIVKVHDHLMTTSWQQGYEIWWLYCWQFLFSWPTKKVL